MEAVQGVHLLVLLINLSQTRRDDLRRAMLVGRMYQAVVVLHRDIIPLQWVTGQHRCPLLPYQWWNRLQKGRGFALQQAERAIACVEGKIICDSFPYPCVHAFL